MLRAVNKGDPVARVGRKVSMERLAPSLQRTVLTCLAFAVYLPAIEANAASPPQASLRQPARVLCEQEAVDGQMVTAAATATGARFSETPIVGSSSSEVANGCANYVSQLEQNFGLAKDLKLINLVKDISEESQARVRAALPLGNPALPPMVEFGALPNGLDSITLGSAPIAQHIFSLESKELGAVLFRRRAEKGVLLMLAEKKTKLFCVYSLQTDVGEFNELYLRVLFINTKPHPVCSLRRVPDGA